jgi:hypothetical protein
VSKETALGRFKQTFSDLAGSIDTLGENPLPASYEVRLRTGPAAEAGVEALGAKLRETPGVADVRYDRQWLSRLMSAISVIRGVGLVMGAVLAIAAALTVASVVRLALHARRDEIEIMQLVGAPTAYVRGPFVMEGVIQGGVGALVAVTALAATFFLLRGPYLVPLAAAVNVSSIRFLPVELRFCSLSGDGGGLHRRVGRRLGPLRTALKSKAEHRECRVGLHLDTCFHAALDWWTSLDIPGGDLVCHASRPIRGRPARTTLSSFTAKNSSNIIDVFRSSALLFRKRHHRR